jgi:hypothetical protein
MHSPPCVAQKYQRYVCPAPERPLTDMEVSSHQNAPTLYGVQSIITAGTATGPVAMVRTGSAAIVEGADGASGSGARVTPLATNLGGVSTVQATLS